MKIALVHDFLVKMGGAERVLKVFSDLYPDAPIYTLVYDEEVCGKTFPAARVRPTFLQRFPKFLRKRYRLFLPLMSRAIESLDLSEFDLVISSSNSFAHGVLTSSTARHICYCHSPMRYAWDYAHEYLREQNMGPVRRWIASKMMHRIRMWDKVAADRVDTYVAASQHVQKRIQKYFREPSTVLYPPVHTEKLKLSTKHEDYFLIISRLTPNKKVDLAVQLFNKIDKKLKIIGTGLHLDYLKSIAGPNIEFLGYQDTLENQEYLRNCRALIFPGEEDFGIVPVEAMACGKPVLGYGFGGLKETVIPGVTGEFFYEQTIESMEDGLGRLILNEPNYDAKKIRKHAEQFSVENFLKGWEQLTII